MGLITPPGEASGGILVKPGEEGFTEISNKLADQGFLVTTTDLERAQNALQGAVSTLEQRMRQRIAEARRRLQTSIACRPDKRLETIGPRFNSVVTVNRERVLAEATQADRIATRPAAKRPRATAWNSLRRPLG